MLGHNYVSHQCSAVFVQTKDKMQHVIKSLRPLMGIPALVSAAGTVLFCYSTILMMYVSTDALFRKKDVYMFDEMSWGD